MISSSYCFKISLVDFQLYNCSKLNSSALIFQDKIDIYDKLLMATSQVRQRKVDDYIMKHSKIFYEVHVAEFFFC